MSGNPTVSVGPPSTQEVVKDLRKAAEVGVGTEYAAALGWIRGITNASRWGRYANLSDAEKLAEIVRVLDAVDQVVDDLAAPTP